jgi:tRNA pseudouridine32 synthase/23S rRNA pseudouridine746 synthase
LIAPVCDAIGARAARRDDSTTRRELASDARVAMTMTTTTTTTTTRAVAGPRRAARAARVHRRGFVGPSRAVGAPRRARALARDDDDDDDEVTTSSGTTRENAKTPRVLYENDAVVIVNKPPGVSFHSEFEPGALARLRASRDAREERLRAVHRLDKGTSGTLVFAKTADAAKKLSDGFATRAIVKYYVGISGKKPKKKMGTVTGDMARARRKAYKLTNTKDNPAVTKFVSFGAKGRRMFIFRPLTGKTHQLRVCAKSLGAPLLGDDVYSGAVAERCYLHACAIRIPESLGLGPAIQIICSPDEGEAWDLEAFERHFPSALAKDSGAWFDDQPLLRSTLEAMTDESS